MRQDQFEALQARAEQLIDLFLAESRPEVWPGHGIEPAKMDKATRGDRVWCKRDAVATLACAQRIANLVDVARAKTAGGSDSPDAVGDGSADDLEAEVAAAEQEAEQLAAKVMRKAQARETERRPNGSP